jgi:hypothetical protein
MKAKYPPAGRASRRADRLNKDGSDNAVSIKPVSPMRQAQQERHDRDKKLLTTNLINLIQSRHYTAGAVIEACVDCADYYSFLYLKRHERQQLQLKFLRLVET